MPPKTTRVRVWAFGDARATWGIATRITMGGLDIACPRPTPAGTNLVVELQSPFHLRIRTRVIRSADGRPIGCIFVGMPPSSCETLRSVLGRSGGLPPIAGTIPPT